MSDMSQAKATTKELLKHCLIKQESFNGWKLWLHVSLKDSLLKSRW